MSREERKIEKVLIANRGEIAIRVMRTCRDMGIKTVAVYSDADAGSLAVRYADEAVHIGGNASAESYLNMQKIIDVALERNADAIHPGFGFLAERASFSQACVDNGLIFIGPSPEAITLMGDKQTARDTARDAGVPIVPGTEAGLTRDELIAAGEAIGAPVLVKATAGGGGKGMRPVHDITELSSAIESASREATSSFGNGAVYIEKLITDSRHIEIQVLGDEHGNAIHFGERECSLQRRNQKLIEEAPSHVITPEVRAEMGRVGCQLVRQIGYTGVGTIEFLYDADGFYFLEMNTRIQVEHPVTELVYGVDLVREQLNVAMGKPLDWDQDTITPRGWSIECRINAEDPYNKFMPATGTIEHLVFPTGPGIRVETGIEQGADITPYYDAMIAKLITYGRDRKEATERMIRALKETQLAGLTTNIPYHLAMLSTPDWETANFDTNYVETRFSMDDHLPTQQEQAALIAALAEHESRQSRQSTTKIQSRPSAWRWGKS